MAGLTAETRSELRRLKGAFDAAFSNLPRDAPREGTDYRAARDAYDLWRVAVDRYGPVLLDALDAAEADLAPADPVRDHARRSPVERLTVEQQADLRTAFQDLDRMGEMVRLIEDP